MRSKYLLNLEFLELNQVKTNRHIIVLLAASLLSTYTYANDDSIFNFYKVDSQLINYDIEDSTTDENWIKTTSKKTNTFFNLSTKQTNSFRDEVQMAWNFTDFFSVNVNLFEDNNYSNYFSLPSLNANSRPFNKSTSTSLATGNLDVNTRLQGYKIGVSSDFGIGEKLKVGINLDYGTLNRADLVGFRSENVNTSSFELGIRNSKFGASVITDGVIENNTFLTEQSRMGIEIDWHFSDNTTFSFGTKKQMNKNDTTTQTTTLDNLSGNVQYIKFQHNL